MTITMRPEWKVAADSDPDQQVDGEDGRPCLPGLQGARPICPGFALFGPELIAEANEGQGPYSLDSPVYFASDVDPCPANVEFDIGSFTAVAAPRFAPVGDHTAHYRVWRMTCRERQGIATSGPAPVVTQHVWHLPRSRILVVDEWSTPGLEEALAGARWNSHAERRGSRPGKPASAGGISATCSSAQTCALSRPNTVCQRTPRAVGRPTSSTPNHVCGAARDKTAPAPWDTRSMPHARPERYPTPPRPAAAGRHPGSRRSLAPDPRSPRSQPAGGARRQGRANALVRWAVLLEEVLP